MVTIEVEDYEVLDQVSNEALIAEVARRAARDAFGEFVADLETRISELDVGGRRQLLCSAIDEIRLQRAPVPPRMAEFIYETTGRIV